MRSILIDAGPVVALPNPDDPHHERVSAFFSHLGDASSLLTTWPVVTECAWLLRQNEPDFWDWLLIGKTEVIEFSMDNVVEMWRWRMRYRDRQVDFADASLVWLAQYRRTNLIATIDFNDFETYRLPDGQPFELLIARY